MLVCVKRASWMNELKNDTFPLNVTEAYVGLSCSISLSLCLSFFLSFSPSPFLPLLPAYRSYSWIPCRGDRKCERREWIRFFSVRVAWVSSFPPEVGQQKLTETENYRRFCSLASQEDQALSCCVFSPFCCGCMQSQWKKSERCIIGVCEVKTASINESDSAGWPFLLLRGGIFWRALF